MVPAEVQYSHPHSPPVPYPEHQTLRAGSAKHRCEQVILLHVNWSQMGTMGEPSVRVFRQIPSQKYHYLWEVSLRLALCSVNPPNITMVASLSPVFPHGFAGAPQQSRHVVMASVTLGVEKTAGRCLDNTCHACPPAACQSN